MDATDFNIKICELKIIDSYSIYFKEYLNTLHEYLKSINSGLIFSTVSYITDEGILDRIEPEFSSFETKSKIFLNLVYDQAKKFESISFTKALLERENNKSLLLYKKIASGKVIDNPILTIRNLIEFDLSQNDNETFIAEFITEFGINEEESILRTKKIMKSYFDFANEIGETKPFFAYLLRPFTNHLYNGMAFICTSKSLSTDEINTVISSLAISFNEIILRNLRKAQIKSAKAAIMARNISHNLGSHVMYYLNLKLDNVNSILKENVLSELIRHDSQIAKNLNCKFLNNTSNIDCKIQNWDKEAISLPFLVGLGRFINYLQERMDFIATISTDFIPYFMPVNFKDSVYDELNYDLKIERHRGDVQEFQGKNVENILLEYIARSEGLNRDNIEIHFGKFDGKDDKSKDLDRLREINVDLPGGEVGRQAIFSIFENIIRNAAKHSGSLTKGVNSKLIFTINAETSVVSHPELIKISVSDNISHDQNLCAEGGKIFQAWKEEYVDKYGELNEAGKGIKEMRISASWLLGISDERIFNKNGNIQILTPRIDPTTGNLIFEFYLLKPQHVAIISNNFHELFEKSGLFSETEFAEKLKAVNEILGNFGWFLYSSEDFKKSNSRHKLIVIDTKFTGDSLVQLYKKCHSRTLIYDIEKDTKLKEIILNPANSECQQAELFLLFYRQHTENVLKLSANKLTKIGVDDQKTLDKFPKEKNESFNKSKIPYGIIYKYNDDQKLLRSVESLIFVTVGENEKQEFNILFKKHFLSKDTFEQDKKLSYDYIESITGHNSTDRLIRNGALDENWFIQMNEAALTRVAIFDERLWSDVTGIDNDAIEQVFSIHKPQASMDNMAESIKSYFSSESFEKHELHEKTNYIFDNILNSNKNLVYSEFNKNIKTFIKEYFEHSKNINIEEIKNWLNSINPIIDKLYTNAKISSDAESFLVLSKKLISVFNIVLCGENKFAIVENSFGINGDSFSSSNSKKQHIGWIQLNNKGEIIIKQDFKSKYHFISIHQGILDKIYETFKIKDQPKKMIELTTLIKNEFCYPSENKFLNQLIIHSGRSRPSIEDMPQDVPFVQFSSIKNSLKDCKFSLTEIFYAARSSK